MNINKGVLAAALVLSSLTTIPTIKAETKIDSCVASTTTYNYTSQNPEFESVVKFLNQQVSLHVDPSSPVTLTNGVSAPVNSTAEMLEVHIENISCGTPSQMSANPDVSPMAIGGCDYVGCTGSLPPEFGDLPAGSTVTMSSCGGGISESGTFERLSNGSWVMKSYRTEAVTSCPPGS